jgi:hypothetical protein
MMSDPSWRLPLDVRPAANLQPSMFPSQSVATTFGKQVSGRNLETCKMMGRSKLRVQCAIRKRFASECFMRSGIYKVDELSGGVIRREYFFHTRQLRRNQAPVA